MWSRSKRKRGILLNLRNVFHFAMKHKKAIMTVGSFAYSLYSFRQKRKLKRKQKQQREYAEMNIVH